MSNPEKNEQRTSAAKGFFRTLLSTLTHNWGWKLGCLIAAIFLWSGLIMQDGTLVRSKVFNDVAISVLNEDVLMRNGGLRPGCRSPLRPAHARGRAPARV